MLPSNIPAKRLILSAYKCESLIAQPKFEPSIAEMNGIDEESAPILYYTMISQL